MSLIRKMVDKMRSKRKRPSNSVGTVTRNATPDAPPKIMTEWGEVTESARLQAAANIRSNPDVRKRVEELLTRQYGSREAAVVEMKRRYPEAYDGK